MTCFAYGQTGSGKTFTMNGSEKIGVIGLYALGANDMFSYLADVLMPLLSLDFSIWQPNCLISKYIVASYMIYWIKDRNWK